MRSETLLEAATVCHELLDGAAHSDADWDGPAGMLDWTCRRTLDHLPDTMLLYAAHLATRATRGLPFVRDGDPGASVRHLVRTTQSSAAILAEVAAAAGPDVRAYHPAGMADAGGFVAMGCDELLIHTHDIATGLARPFTPPPDLCAGVVARLFPWVAGELGDVEPWPALLWANGRGPLWGHPQLDPDWYWHAAPLAEWDGSPRTRTAPPAWST